MNDCCQTTYIYVCVCVNVSLYNPFNECVCVCVCVCVCNKIDQKQSKKYIIQLSNLNSTFKNNKLIYLLRTSRFPIFRWVINTHTHTHTYIYIYILGGWIATLKVGSFGLSLKNNSLKFIYFEAVKIMNEQVISPWLELNSAFWLEQSLITILTQFF